MMLPKHKEKMVFLGSGFSLLRLGQIVDCEAVEVYGEPTLLTYNVAILQGGIISDIQVSCVWLVRLDEILDEKEYFIYTLSEVIPEDFIDRLNIYRK